MVFLQCRRTAGDHAVSSSLRVSGSSAEIILLSGFVGGTTYFWLWSRSVLMDFRKMTDTKPHLHSWWGGLGSSTTDWTQRAILRLPTGKGLSQFLRSLRIFEGILQWQLMIEQSPLAGMKGGFETFAPSQRTLSLLSAWIHSMNSNRDPVSRWQ